MHIAIEIKFLHAKIFHGCKKLKSGATKLEALYVIWYVIDTYRNNYYVGSLVKWLEDWGEEVKNKGSNPAFSMFFSFTIHSFNIFSRHPRGFCYNPRG